MNSTLRIPGHHQHRERRQHDRAEPANDSAGDADARRRLELLGQDRSQREGAEQRTAERNNHGDDVNEQHEDKRKICTASSRII